MKISVIVPVYKVERYLRDCVDSILNQSFLDFELILVDDGSPDSCPLICDDYEKKDKRVIVIHKINGGLSSARNAGLDIAKGEYIAFIDSDDIVDKDFLSTLYFLAKNNNCELSVCKSLRFNNFVNIESVVLDTSYSILSPIEYWEGCKKIISEIDFVVSWNKLYKKELFEKMRFPVGMIHEDEFLIHKIVFLTKTIAVSNAILYFYRARENSIICNGENYFNQCEALIDRINFALSINEFKIVNETLAKFYNYYYKINDSNQRKVILNFFKKSVKSISIKQIGFKKYIKIIIFCNFNSLFLKLIMRKKK